MRPHTVAGRPRGRASQLGNSMFMGELRSDTANSPTMNSTYSTALRNGRVFLEPIKNQRVEDQVKSVMSGEFHMSTSEIPSYISHDDSTQHTSTLSNEVRRVLYPYFGTAPHRCSACAAVTSSNGDFWHASSMPPGVDVGALPKVDFTPEAKRSSALRQIESLHPTHVCVRKKLNRSATAPGGFRKSKVQQDSSAHRKSEGGATAHQSSLSNSATDSLYKPSSEGDSISKTSLMGSKASKSSFGGRSMQEYDPRSAAITNFRKRMPIMHVDAGTTKPSERNCPETLKNNAQLRDQFHHIVKSCDSAQRATRQLYKKTLRKHKNWEHATNNIQSKVQVLKMLPDISDEKSTMDKFVDHSVEHQNVLKQEMYRTLAPFMEEKSGASVLKMFPIRNPKNGRIVRNAGGSQIWRYSTNPEIKLGKGKLLTLDGTF